MINEDMKLNADELRKIDDEAAESSAGRVERRPIYLIVESVYDTYNIGGLFRLADALAVSGLYLCGECETPPNHRIKKASIGTYKVVPWKYFDSTREAIEELRAQHSELSVVGIEQAPGSADYRKIEYRAPMALIVGNETFGVTKETLALCDQIAEIPMWGINKSLNVIVSAAIVSYHAAASGVGAPR